MADEITRETVPQGQVIPFLWTFPEIGDELLQGLDCTNFDEADDAFAYLYTHDSRIIKFSMNKKSGHTKLIKISSTQLYGQIDVDNSKLLQPGILWMELALTDTTTGVNPKQTGLSNPIDTHIDIIKSNVKDSL